jgi:hypothetical protein
LLADPDLEDLFYLRFAERGLMQYDMVGYEPQGQGPIIIAIDESGSMTTDYGGMTGEVWSLCRMRHRLHYADSRTMPSGSLINCRNAAL